MSGERTESASQHRRQKAQKDGDRPRSRELLSAAALLAGSVALGYAARGWTGEWRARYESALAMSRMPDPNPDALGRAARGLMVAGAAPCLLVMLSAVAGSVAVGVAQNRGASIHPAALAPKWNRVNPFENVKQLFSSRALVRLGKSLVPVIILTLQLVHHLTALAHVPVFSLERLPDVFAAAYSMLVTTAWVLLAWSAVDYIVEWRQWESRLKMSKQDLRDEMKETEGSPQLKGRIRSLQRQMRSRTIRADVRKASVVITNPTHYAVALSFDMATMEAPKVLAKGRDLVAAQIREEARWAGVPLVENPPLARSLFRAVEPGQSIPAELYAAVAAILAYLFRQEAEERMRQEMQQQQSQKQQQGYQYGARSRAGTATTGSSPSSIPNHLLAETSAPSPSPQRLKETL
jgi:flagellar biosynthetic protein FlhB